MDDNELNRLFDMTGEGEDDAAEGKPARKGFFARFKREKKEKKASKKGLLDDVLDFSDDDINAEEGTEEELTEQAADETAGETAEQIPEENAEGPADEAAVASPENEDPAAEEAVEETSEVSEETEDEESGREEGSDEAAPEEDSESEEEGGTEETSEEEEEQEQEIPEQPAAAVTHKRKYRLKTPDIDIPKPSRKVVLASVLALLLITIVLLVALHPAFRVKYMKIDGNIVVSDQEILEETKLKYNAHLLSGISGNILDILKLNYGKTEEKIKKENPYIKDIEISVSLPSTVNIRVDERAKISYVKTPDGYAALDRDGTVLELSSEAGDVRPVISGLVVDSATLGDKCVIENITDYQRAIIVLGAILQVDNSTIENDYRMFANTAEIRILPSGYMFLTIYTPLGSLLQVKLDSTESITDDMTWLRYALVSGGFENLPDGALDMTGDEYIYRPY